ncbi:MAG: MerR family transcriptional regulator [Taibaiella sp.]|nr:MerR family transcriptional regulator [Taibaiella sp.]
MSIHMPTLFDDEEYFVPPPKKESRKKKDVPEAKDEVSKDAETDAAADPVVPSRSLTEEAGALTGDNINTGEVTPETTVVAQPVEEVTEETPTNIQAEQETGIASTEALPETIADEVIEPVAPVQGAIEAAPAVDAVTGSPTEMTLTESEPEAAEEQVLTAEEAVLPEAAELPVEEAIELEQEAEETEHIVAAPLPEIIEVSAVDELAVELPKTTPGIAFEIPEEVDTPAIDLEMTARPIPAIREDKVDDLDQLMRTELISQDYTAFSGFAFEPQPEKKKIIPEPEATSAEPATSPEKEDISLAVQEIDAAGLDFEFESDALASSLPEFDLENKYYTIGEVAALFGVNVSHIRFWTTEFNLKVRTTRKGDRLYNPENIARLRLIHHLVKENGFTIKGAKEKLKHQKQNVSSQVDLKNKLNGLKDKLERIKKNL